MQEEQDARAETVAGSLFAPFAPFALFALFGHVFPGKRAFAC